MVYDITWCTSECANTDCFRNQKNLPDNADQIWIGAMRGTTDCIGHKELEK